VGWLWLGRPVFFPAEPLLGIPVSLLVIFAAGNVAGELRSRRKWDRVNGVQLGNPFKNTVAEQVHPFCVDCFNLGFLRNRRRD
jgi:hypothetical protein